MDLHFGKPGEDTCVLRYMGGDEVTVEHWRMENAPHVPDVIANGEFSGIGEKILNWIEAHPKPAL